MSHSVSSLPPLHLSLRWWIAALVVVTAASVGGYGLWKYENDHHPPADSLSVAYHTVQLFVLHAPHLEHKANWQIHVGRWLSALVVFWAVIRGTAVLFKSEWKLFCTRIRGGHVIICGLGRLGRQLAAEFHGGGSRVVVIEAHNDKLEAAGDGIVVLTGDACDVKQLRQAGVHTARQLIAVCDDVQTNVAIAATAGEVLNHFTGRRHSKALLESWVFIPDADLRQLLKRDKLFPYTSSRFHVNVRGLDLFSLAARQVLAAKPLDFVPIAADSLLSVHLVIVGFGPMGQRLALQTAQLGHYANGRKPKITVLEAANSDRVDLFLKRYSKFSDVIDFNSRDFSYDVSDAAKQILDVSRSGNDECVTIAICWDSQIDSVTGEEELFRLLEKDDAVNLRLALNMHQIGGDAMPRMLLFQTRRCGFASLFIGESESNHLRSKISVFGTLEETCSLDVLMHESTDAVARVLHEDWYDKQIEAGKKNGDKPALWPWSMVDEIYKESNRHAADHINVKLRAIGCKSEKRRKEPNCLTAIDDPMSGPVVELLAEMEHARWCAELKLMGYTYATGPRDDTAKTHSNLVLWKDLDEATKEYDRSQVRAIPKALERAGFAIYPIEVN